MGIVVSYVRWIYHGESYDVSDDDISVDEVDGASDDLNDDDLDEMLNNIGQCKWCDKLQATGRPLEGKNIEISLPKNSQESKGHAKRQVIPPTGNIRDQNRFAKDIGCVDKDMGGQHEASSLRDEEG
ncbi:unnamed protein product [Lactuca virosa]|uniref:Uncharacterized protein n=1 Tax=Lactuca virosa TaxID=75947 RepID=A0AAU9N7H6_9ASTR|nr:unnamed protein product [Lactuca virosa]